VQDIFESVGDYVDGLKFSGGSHSMMPKATIKQAIDMAHQHDVYVSTGDWAEHMVSKSPSSFKEYVEVSLCPPDSILILVLVVVLFCDELWFFISDLIIFLKLWFLTVLNDIVV